MKKIPHVIVLGGGYVAVKCVRGLHRLIKKNQVKVTVIDRNNFHFFHGLVPEMIVGKIQPGGDTPRRVIPNIFLDVV